MDVQADGKMSTEKMKRLNRFMASVIKTSYGIQVNNADVNVRKIARKSNEENAESNICKRNKVIVVKFINTLT